MGAAAAPILIGSALGAVTNRKNPLQGALLGGVLGGVGGSFMGGAMNAGNAAATATMTGANPAVMGTAGMGTTALNPSLAFNAAAPMAKLTMPTYAATGGSTGLIGSTTAPVTMMDRLKAVGDFNRQNPMVGQMGSSAFQSLNEPQPMAAAPAPGLLRGNPSQEQPPQYAMGMPQINLLG